ncbi:amidase [Erythrobacteraceae bacterium CFH 75059]|uniref:amidase n=1 Tax=Qipengyuania thermophila TaxID=2509361 RepID=UPI00101F7DA5|nr:amidase [Qipengyuania thermophila]TCD02028.1 amidase [Erythrobacteraceae bacterium CFH 75059]
MIRPLLAACALSLIGSQPLLAQERREETPTLRIEPPTSELPVPWFPAERPEEADLLANLVAISTHEGGADGVNAIVTLNPDVQRDIRAALDRRLPLAGRTVLVKDNIETRELPTTAGSLALAGNGTGRDAPLIARLRQAGGAVLGKTNLSEWANIRDTNSTSGWSALGGLTRNPHAVDRNACGSSSGSGAAVAAGFAWAALGTETNGSITCPASVNGVVGFKPTVGLVSRTHIVPISGTQDTAGPMARTVRDAAMLLTAISGHDPADPATAEADRHRTDFAAALEGASLKGMRIGVLTRQVGSDARVAALLEQAKADMVAAGAVLVPVDYDWPDGFWSRALAVLLFELRRDMDAYLASLPDPAMPDTLADLVAFNAANAAAELRWFGQDLFERALTARDEAAYRAALETNLRATREEGIDRLLAEHEVAVLIAPTTGPAWPIDLVLGDHFPRGIGAGALAAIAGYPHLTVPMGAVERLPVGLSFIGGRWQDAAILRAGAAFEQIRSAPVPSPSFRRWEP